MGGGIESIEGYGLDGATAGLFSLNSVASDPSAKAFEEALQREARNAGNLTPAPQNEGASNPGEHSSGWTRVMGAVKTAGGAVETAFGAGLTAVGVATSEFGIGIPIAAAGAFVTAHGMDTAVSGFRTMRNGEDTDSLTSQGLQELGMSRGTANLADAGIGIVGSLGASAALRAPAVASALTKAAQSETSIAVAYGRMGPMGHNAVGVNTGGGTRWTELVVDRAGDAIIRSVPQPAISRYFNSVTVPVSAERAEQAAQAATKAVMTPAGRYGYFANDCATYATSIQREGGLWTLPITTPKLNYLTAAAQSPEVLNALRPTLSAVGLTAAGINGGVTAKEVIDK